MTSVRPSALFLDDGGVISDNNARAAQWRQLVARFFSPLLGGHPEAWVEANREVITAISETTAWDARLRAAPDYETFERGYFIDWLGAMCGIVGVARPDDQEALDLSRRATRWTISRVRAAYPGAAKAIRSLNNSGYRLCTASGEPSTDLHGYLQSMQVDDCFDRLYGPDLIETFKNGPAFYRRLLADAGVDPEDALVVDDNPEALTWASEVGVLSVLVGSAQPAGPAGMLGRIDSLAQLPELLERSAS